jgi:DNA polymerase III delta prime subunit
MSSEVFSFLIYGGSKEDRMMRLSSLVDEKFSKKSEVGIYSVLSQKENSLGIAKIRETIKSLEFTDLRFSQRVCIFEDAHKITHEAQNALLKLLEEPPANTLLLLETANKDSLLPTVLSRLVQVYVAGVTNSIGKSGFPEFDELRKLNIGQLFELAEKYSKDKESVRQFLFHLVAISRTFMLSLSHSNTRERKKWSPYLDFLLQAYEWISSTTVSGKFLLENCLLGFKNVTKDL